jgi:hypothetical protein
MPRCKHCRTKFVPKFFLAKFCLLTEECKIAATMFGIAEVKKKADKDWQQEKKVLKEKLKSQADYVKDLQAVFNTFIRLRDKDLPCVSCGVFVAEEFHAGHYIPTTFQILRFNEFNVWKQCSRCNTHLRGNITAYRIELINRIGLNEVEKIENKRHEISKLSIPDLKAKIVHYKAQIKILCEK